MSARKLQCPSCGAALELEHRFSKLVVCKYCSQVSQVTAEGLDPTGKTGALGEFPSIFSVGKKVSLAGTAHQIIGRLRYKYEDGFWDEWLLLSPDGGQVWLQEDEGELTAFRSESIRSAVPPFEKVSVGSSVEVNGKSVFITEKVRSVIAGAEGELPFRALPGDVVDCADGNAEGKAVSIEYAPDEIEFFIGEAIDRKEIEIPS
jgi:hypothetical protein